MPPKITSNRWRVVLGYIAFGLAALLFSFYVSFPYGAVRQRLLAEAARLDLELKIGRLGPGFLGISATNVQLSKRTLGNDSPGPPIVLRSVTLRPSLFPLGFAFSAKGLGGGASGAVGGLGDLSLRLDVDELNAADQSIKALSGLDLSGKVSTHLSLSLPKSSSGPAGKEPEVDLSQANGNLSIKLDQLLVKGGSLNIPNYGEVDLPRVALGNVECKIKFEKGLGKIDKLQGKSDDLDLSATGTVKLAKQLDYSNTNVDWKFKAESDLVKRLGILGAGLAVLPMDKDNPGFRMAKMTGFLGRPNFNPGR